MMIQHTAVDAIDANEDDDVVVKAETLSSSTVDLAVVW